MRPLLAPQIKDMRKEVVGMANTRQTGSKAASNAGKTLVNPKATPAEKSAAASALSQTPSHKKKK
jgi:D-arabinose 5-phosphate isomerase GutQ